MPISPPIRLGTRASALARWQAEWVAERLRERGTNVELVPLSTRGDRQQGQPIGALGGEGLFTKELQRALLAHEIDLAVHSLKDLPTERVEGLCLAAVPPRGPVGDVLVARGAKSFGELPDRAKVGTGSLRRRAQLLHARPDLQMRDVRGNVDTRLGKLADGEFDALVLAEAGLVRLGLESEITEVLPRSLILPAIGQGALGIETRDDDAATRAAVAPLDDTATHAAVIAERAMLAALCGGCLAPVGGWARIESDGRLHLDGVVLDALGAHRLLASDSDQPAQATTLGQRVAQRLIEQGAADMIAASRQSN